MNTFEEIKAIWEQQCNYHRNDLHASIDMEGSHIFMSNAVEWLMERYNHWIISVQFDPVYHDVYQIDVIKQLNGIESYRWVNVKYLKQYHKNNFDYQIDNKHITEFYQEYSPLKILAVARDAVEGIRVHEEAYESIELDLTDSELALIARAAHAEDITINEFMNNVIREELDKVMPDWREEVKKSL